MTRYAPGMRLRVWLPVALAACSSDSDPRTAACSFEVRFEHGNAEGHRDPFGARAAKQARAGRIHDASQIVQGPLARGRVRVGDFALANDRIALYIEAEGRREGYSPFGGDVIAIEPVGDDGRPRGMSAYGETLIALSRQTVKPDRVSVLGDGSDGKAAIVRVSGVLENIPFLDTFRAISPGEYGFPAALDYVLSPGAEKVVVRLNILNPTSAAVDFSASQRLGFFHASRSQLFTPAAGFGPAQGEQSWVGFESPDGGAFGFRAVGGTLRAELEIAGLQLFSAKGLSAGACESKAVDTIEIFSGGPGIDGLAETRRRIDGEAPWQEVRGVVREAETNLPLARASVHAIDDNGRYVSRVRADDTGAFVIHAPSGASLTPTLQGWAIPAATPITAGNVTLELPRRSVIDVTITDATTSSPVPARVQVIPAAPLAAAPRAFGVREELDGRLWQSYVLDGRVSLPVPAGTHRVIVSRGYGWELVDTFLIASPAAPSRVDARLRRSIPADGTLCADFHEHSFFSVDAGDALAVRVAGAIADGLDIPVSSEHEWVVDFGPVVRDLGMTKWAFGMASSELTTFEWGHFGIVPMTPRPELPNNGAIDWVGKKPAAIFEQVHTLPEDPVLIVNHPSGGGFDAYFSAAGFSRATATGSPELWSDAFGAVEVFNDSDFDRNREGSVADWFALLNAGKTVWAVGNSDTHDARTRYAGYPRTCLRFGMDTPERLTPELVRDALRSGAAVVDGGLAMSVEGPNGVGPGGRSTAGRYRVTVRTPTWIEASEIEAWVDGVEVASVPATRGARMDPYVAEFDIVPQGGRPRHWVVFHARGRNDLAPLHPKRRPFAVSNPIFF
jgi:hypothetical protein